MDVFTVEAWSRFAASAFEMVEAAAGRGEDAFAEGTGDFSALVDAGVEVL